jgi:hypothetical protein
MLKYSEMTCFSAGCAAPVEKVRSGAGRATTPKAKIAQTKAEETMVTWIYMYRRNIKREYRKGNATPNRLNPTVDE